MPLFDSPATLVPPVPPTPPGPVSLRFADAIRQLGSVCRHGGWVLPDYRSPPGMAGVVRTLRRRADGSTVVAVLLHGRPWEQIVADLIEGVVAANGLDGNDAAGCRRTLGLVLGSGGETPMAA